MHGRTAEADSAELKLKRGDTLLIEFSDMGMTLAYVMAADGSQACIKVDGYRTRRGTHISAKKWRVQRINHVYGSPCYQVRRSSSEKRTPRKSPYNIRSEELPAKRK